MTTDLSRDPQELGPTGGGGHDASLTSASIPKDRGIPSFATNDELSRKQKRKKSVAKASPALAEPILNRWARAVSRLMWEAPSAKDNEVMSKGASRAANEPARAAHRGKEYACYCVLTLLVTTLTGCVSPNPKEGSTSSTPQSGPFIYHSGDSSFNLTFPKQPDVEDVGGSLAVSVTQYREGQMTLFREPNPQHLTSLPGGEEALTKPLVDRGWHIVSIEKNSHQGFPATTCVAEKGTARMEATEVLTTDHVYRLVVSAPQERFRDTEFSGFVDSFTLTTVPVKTTEIGKYKLTISDKQSLEKTAKAFEIGDSDTAFKLASDLAGRGNPLAQFLLGHCYESGMGCPSNSEKALAYYRKAADGGVAPAQYKLGQIYFKGRGVPRDYKIAFNYLKQSADQGYTAAQANLGILYSEGFGVDQSYEKAAACFLAAADKGLVLAQANIAELYFYGYGVELDYSKAYLWYWIAESGGDWKSTEKLNLIRKLLSPPQVKKAEALARARKAKIARTKPAVEPLGIKL